MHRMETKSHWHIQDEARYFDAVSKQKVTIKVIPKNLIDVTVDRQILFKKKIIHEKLLKYLTNRHTVSVRYKENYTKKEIPTTMLIAQDTNRITLMGN